MGGGGEGRKCGVFNQESRARRDKYAKCERTKGTVSKNNPFGGSSPFGLHGFTQRNDTWPGKIKHLLSPFKMLIDNKMKGSVYFG